MPLTGIMGAAACRGLDISKFIDTYERLSSRTGTNPVRTDVIPTIWHYCSEMIQVMINMMIGDLRKNWELLNEKLKDAFRHANS